MSKLYKGIRKTKPVDVYKIGKLNQLKRDQEIESIMQEQQKIYEAHEAFAAITYWDQYNEFYTRQ